MPNAKTNLVIVESPSKAKTIGKYLGPDYQVKASMGHLRDLRKSTMSVDIDHDFEPEYYPIKGKEDIIKDLQSAAAKSANVFLATDPDREGEAISWHLKYLLDIPDDRTYRVTFNEITKDVVRKAIAAPRAIDQNLVDAQQARRVLDRIVGYQLSPLLWKKVRRGLSAGRVQSVATRLVVDRENEIRAFTPQEYWTIDETVDLVPPLVGDQRPDGSVRGRDRHLADAVVDEVEHVARTVDAELRGILLLFEDEFLFDAPGRSVDAVETGFGLPVFAAGVAAVGQRPQFAVAVDDQRIGLDAPQFDFVHHLVLLGCP